jgi:hypothetical protein
MPNGAFQVWNGATTRLDDVRPCAWLRAFITTLLSQSNVCCATALHPTITCFTGASAALFIPHVSADHFPAANKKPRQAMPNGVFYLEA